MTATDIAQYISDGLEVALVIRLLLMRLHSVYRVFCAFLLFDVFSSAVFFITTHTRYLHLDYRWAWMTLRPVAWVLALWMVYALVNAILANLPGILRLSHKILNVVFVGALALALITAEPEYSASQLSASAISGNRAMAAVFVMERVIFMAALLILLAMLAFILWFPVQMPRNLAFFSAGFVIFFASTTALFLAHTYAPNVDVRVISQLVIAFHSACLAYWLIVLNKAGETKPVRMGHSWGPAEQKRLVGQLESMNAALLRTSRRENY
ncbi:MAG TPA: hypothetical protein VMF91_20065 [Bryobacteraceae bacterium]|nr:hypothetical protein [Bryobacteraceae bacterium]